MARDPSELIDRGRRAERELSETEAAFTAVEDAILRALRETGVGNDDKILKLHMSLHNLAAIRAAIGKVIRDGKDAASYARAADDAIAEEGLTRP